MYCLQHPERYCVSAKSLAAHLTGLAWALEFGGDEKGLKALQQFLDGRTTLTKPTMPESRGELTIGDVAGAATPDDYVRAQGVWARATWAAYERLHETALAWVGDATRGRGYRPPR